MAHIIPDALLFGFEFMSEGTALEGAELIIEDVSTKGRCRACGQEFVVKDWFDDCPECGKMNIDIISGKELEIVEFEGA